MPKRVCLPKKDRDKLLTALKSKELSIPELYTMKSADRKALLAKYVGKDDAGLVNAKFEQAMLSKHKNALTRWVEGVTKAKDPIRRDMLKRVERVKEALATGKSGDFLTDLAEDKLGISVTQEEAETILKLKKEVDTFRKAVPETSPKGSKERLQYGLALQKFKDYVGDLTLKAETLSFKERLSPKNFGADIVDTANAFKSIVATLDNSFIGRQGIKALLRGDYKIWSDTLIDSFKLFGKELVAKSPKGMFKNRDEAVMSAVRAEVWSRPNALNGKYTAAKNGYGLGLFHEEAFPSSIPSRIPLLGRVFKASETAFTASALKMRAALADATIAAAEKNGIDVLDETQASALGSLVGSLTGRGELTKFAAAGKEINALMFAPRFLKANFNTLTAHTFDKTMTPYGKRVAAKNILKIAGSVGAMLTVAEILHPGSVEKDPRSPNFGKISVGEHRYDITGGMKGLIVLASRITPSLHNGEWGFWTKSGTTGKYTKMSTGEYGVQTALDTFESFFEGKLSPAAGALRDVWKGQKYGGEKPTVVNTTLGLITPISAQILVEELNKGSDDIVFAMIAEGLGFSATSKVFSGYGKRWRELSEKRGEKVMNEALKIVTEQFNKQADALKATQQWERMDNEQQKKALEKIQTKVTNSVLKSYGI